MELEMLKREQDELEPTIKKLLTYICDNRIMLSKNGKERLIRIFPSLKDEIMKADEVINGFTNDSTTRKKD